MSEQPDARIEAVITRSGSGYAAAIGAALTAQSLAGGPRLLPDPDLTRRLLPQAEPEPELEAG